MKYSKDYFTGMKHLADAVKYELERHKDYWLSMTAQSDNLEKFMEYTCIIAGIKEAIDIVEKTLNMQLDVKGEEDD